MNFKRLLLFLAAPLALVMSSCEPDGPEYSTPSISITDAEGKEVTAINFAAVNAENAEQPQEYVVTIKSTRSWSVSKQATWFSVAPSSYTNDTQLEQSVEVKFTAMPNDGGPRSETIKVVMDKTEKQIVVSQAGEGQTALGDVLYYDNFDKVVAAEIEGKGWPYMSAEYGNPTPENQSGVTYASYNVTIRANSFSDGEHSNYEGSGKNNVFFGKTPNYLTISGISLAELEGNALTMTFGTEKYNKTSGSVFTESEFHVYISADSEKWTEIDYTFGGQAEGKWDIATAQFNLKEVPESISLAFVVDFASSYRLDDLKLTEGGGGAEIDLSQGSELDFESGSGDQGGNQGGETTAPENALLWASFATDMANFTIENVELGGLDHVWYHDAEYKQMKASAFKDNVRYVTESYLVSPVVALTGAEDYYMNFEHTGKYFGNMSEQATLWVREEGGAWAQLTIPTYMTGDNWTFVNSGDIALTAYAGKNIQIGFRYTSTATDAPTWEVKNVLVAKGTASETPETPETPNVPLESIDATSDAAFVCSTDDSANAAYGLGESTANGASATGFKLGKSKQEGKFTSTAVGVSGDKYLNFFAVSWGAGGDKTIYFRVNGGEVKSQDIRANDGAKGNAPYTMSVYANDHYSVLLSGLNETDVIEFGTNADFALTTHTGTGDDYAPRVIFFGVKLTDEPVSGESGEGGGNTEPEDPEDPEDPETPVDPEEPTTVTLDEITEYGTYNITGATVVAVEYSNMVVKGTEKMFNVKKLANASANYNVGDVLSLTNATVKDAYGVTVIDGEATDLVIEKTGTATVEHGEATAIDAAWVTSFTESLVPEYVTVSGVGAASGSAYSLNIAVEGSDINMSVTLPTKDEVTALVGKNVTATGYAFDYNSKNKYVSIMKVDLTVVEGGETPEEPETPVELAGTGEGTLESPYDVVRAKAAIDAYTTVSGVYVKGVVTTSEIKFNSTYSSCDYYISVDGTTDNELMVYSGKFVDGASFTSADQIHAGDEVVVYGDLKIYNGTYEFNYSSKIVSLTCNHETTEPEEPEEPETPVTGAIALPWLETFDGDLSAYVMTKNDKGENYIDSENPQLSTAPELMFRYGTTFTATIASDGSAQTLYLTFNTNNVSRVSVSSTTEGVSVANNGSLDKFYSGIVSVPAGLTSFDIVLTNTTTNSNVRIDNIRLADTEFEKVLTGITVSGATDTFAVGSTFEFDGVVTATYSNTAVVAVEGYTVDSSAVNTEVAGTYEVVVSYTEGGVTETASYNVTVKDASAVVTSTVVILASDFNTSSYAANNGEHTKDGVAYYSNQVMLNNAGKGMQWQKSNGYIYNTVSLGKIESISIDNITGGSFTVYAGTAVNPTETTITGNNGTYDFSAGEYSYFTIKTGSSKAGYCDSVTITFTK